MSSGTCLNLSDLKSADLDFEMDLELLGFDDVSISVDKEEKSIVSVLSLVTFSSDSSDMSTICCIISSESLFSDKTMSVPDAVFLLVLFISSISVSSLAPLDSSPEIGMSVSDAES